MSDPPVLHDANPAELVQADAFNHRELFSLSAIAAGGEVREAEGVTWTYSESVANSMIAFPVLSEDRAGAQLDDIASYYLSHRPKGLVGCWSLDPPQPSDLGARLLARGFQPGWRPCWMALDLHQVHANHAKPQRLEIDANRTTSLQDVQNLPYAEEDTNILNLTQHFPDRVRWFVATLEDQVVAHSAVLLTEGPYGVAGIYSVGVVPKVRNRGIGKAVVLAACLYARERGYHYAVLNATGRRMYEQLGFRWIGDGWTWWLNVPRLAAHPPTRDQVTLAEAVGRGDTAELARLGAGLSVAELETPLTNEKTLLQLAVHLRQPAAAEWLVARGAHLNVLEAWDLEWRDRAKQMLARDPALVNQRYDEWNITLLHEAASRGDVELARLALAANPDLNIQDDVYHSTPLGWARHFHREEIIRLIEKHNC